jgi:sugar (pentulose or hexulose) kinase
MPPHEHPDEPCEVHPKFEEEMETLANRGFPYERSVGRFIAVIEDRFLYPEEDVDPEENWQALPDAEQGRAKELDLRCIDPDDGLITVIATWRKGRVYLASAGLATTKGRAAAVQAAIARVSDSAWCPPRK